MRQAEAVTSFLLPDCHHGEFAMSVLAFSSRISLYKVKYSGVTWAMGIVNVVVHVSVKCLTKSRLSLLGFNAVCVRCRLLPHYNVVCRFEKAVNGWGRQNLFSPHNVVLYNTLMLTICLNVDSYNNL